MVRWRLLFLLNFCVLSGPSLSHADCSPIDLNEGTVLKDMPITDQDGSGLCYAFTASQLIEFKLRSEGKKFSPSPVDLALVDGTKGQTLWNRSTLYSGNVSDTIASAEKSESLPALA